MFWRRIAIVFATSYCFSATAAVLGCGDLANAYGPYDYTNPEHKSEKLPIVESHHFTPAIQNFIPNFNNTLGGDVDYTLRTFPNHHGALKMMIDLSFRDHTDKPAGATYSVECYFDRAMRFKPQDPIVRMLYGTLLYKRGKLDDAIKQMEEAYKIDPDNANINYNIGLMYFEKKDYDKALRHAHKAYEANFPLLGLKNKLVKAGKWQDPKPEPVAETKPAAAKPPEIAPAAKAPDAKP